MREHETDMHFKKMFLGLEKGYTQWNAKVDIEKKKPIKQKQVGRKMAAKIR